MLLDTNVVSELRKAANKRADPRVMAWAARQDPESSFLSAVTVFEIERGILQLERRDEAQGAALRRWFDGDVLPGFEGRILPVDTAVARRCAALHVPDPRPERDDEQVATSPGRGCAVWGTARRLMIAATALVHGLTLATRDVTDFGGMGLKLVNPWDLGSSKEAR
jgi:predicted nucleic acid-binding protein